MRRKSLYKVAIASLALFWAACQPVTEAEAPIDNKIDLQTGSLQYSLAHALGSTCDGYDYSQDVDKLNNIIIGYENGFYYVDWAIVEQVEDCTDNTNPECFGPSDLRRMNISETTAKRVEKMINEMPAYGSDSSCSAMGCASEVILVPANQLLFKQVQNCAEGGTEYSAKFSDLSELLKEIVPDL